MSILDRLAAIEAAPEGPEVGAFFDFDGTIIDGYSAAPLMQERLRRLHIGPEEAAGLFLATLRTLAGKGGEPVDQLMSVGIRALKGRSTADLQRLGEDLAKELLGGWIFREALDPLAAHQRRGHTVAIASSALPFQVEPLARELGIENVLCTRPADDGERFDGTLATEVLWGDRKADAVVAFAAERGVDLAASFAYANGREDVDFLDTVGHATAVNAHPELESTAAERGWQIEPFAPRRKRFGVLDVSRSLASYGSIIGSMGVGVGLGLLNRDRRLAANTTMSLASQFGLALAGVRLNVVGREHLWSQRPFVFIFNHQSWLDGFVVMRLIHEDATGIAKAEIEGMPVFGQFGKLMGFAFVDRGKGDPRTQLEPAVRKIREEGLSVGIAPEGTRSLTPVPGPFKKGAFHLAMQAGVPILPIVLRNTGELQWRAEKWMRPGTVDVEILPPVDVSGWRSEDLDAHVADVRGAMMETLAKWEGGRGVTAPARA